MIIDVSSEPAEACARFFATRIASALAEYGTASLAVSGGSTAPPLFEALTTRAGPAVELTAEQWSQVGVWQVDERVAPDGDEDRNASQLSILPARVHAMPVTDDDLTAASSEYAADLPDTFDVVHLGVGPDGHTASWVPAPHPDAHGALTSAESVFIVGEYQGRERMTLGRVVVNAARCRVVLATGERKASVIARWVEGSTARGTSWVDLDLPVAALDPTNTFVFLDVAAASELGRSDDSVRGDEGRPAE